jgi:glycine oxidase
VAGSETTVVIGGGITGAFVAYLLARRGAPVTVLERGPGDAQASANNPGGLNPLYGAGIPGPLGPLALAAFRLHLEHRDEIERVSAADFDFHHKRRLNLARDADDLRALERMHETYASTDGFSARWVEADELRTIESRLEPGFVRGLWAEGDATVESAAYTEAVLATAVEHGAAVVGAAAEGLEVVGDRVVGVRADGEVLPCGGIVVATGPWTDAAAWLGVRLPVEPVKGDLLLLEAEGGGVTTDLAWRDVMLYRTATHQVWLGGTEEHVGFDAELSETGRVSMLERVGRVVPALATARVVRQTTGLRPVTPDGLPIVGPTAGWSNAWLALGGGRKGMLLSAAMAAAVADLVLDGSSGLPIEPLGVDRFGAGAVAGGAR